MIKRLNSISVIRAISLGMIISCHFFQYYGYEIAFWLNGGVQIFFFISGFLYGLKEDINVKEWYKKQFEKIVLPYYIVLIFVLFFDYTCLGKTYSVGTVVKNLLCLQGFTGCIDELTHTWFISYILLAYLITPILIRINVNELSEKKFIVSLIISLAFIQILEMVDIINIHVPYIYCYILGFYFTKYYVSRQKSYSNFCLLNVALFLCTIIPRLNFQYDLFKIPYISYFTEYKTIFISYNHNFLFISMFIVMYYLFERIELSYTKFLKFSDKYSYDIYLIHQIFILNTFSVLNLTNSNLINILICLVLIIFFSVVLFYFQKNLIKHIKLKANFTK